LHPVEELKSLNVELQAAFPGTLKEWQFGSVGLGGPTSIAPWAMLSRDCPRWTAQAG
jgi:hypothetical protein